MTRLALIGLTSALVAAGAAFAAGSAPETAPPTKPHLRLVDTEPVTVRGVRFAPDQHITVVATTKDSSTTKIARQTKTTRSGEQGGFTVVLASIDFNRCGYLAVTATAASGQRATLKFMPVCGALP